MRIGPLSASRFRRAASRAARHARIGVAVGCIAGQGAVAQAPGVVGEAAFATFSPLVLSATSAQALTRDGRRVDVSFGEALAVVGMADDGTTAEIRLADGDRGWVNAADVVLGDTSARVTTGPEFRVTSRPGMRVYYDHYGLTHFLARGAASADPADLAELHDRPTRFDLSLPVIASGRAHVLGDRTAAIVEVLLPLSADVVDARRALRGITGPGYDIRILVDGSEDAREFASSLLLALARPLEALLAGETAEHRVFLSRYSEAAAYGSYGAVTMADLRRPMEPDRSTRQLTGREPAIRAMARELGQIRDEAAGTVLVVMNGGDIGDLSEMGAPIMNRLQGLSGVILVQTTPEVSPDLSDLAERLEAVVPTTLVDFGATQSRDVMRAVAGIVQADAAPVLSTEDARALCDAAHADGVPCLLPSIDDLSGSFPEPPGGASDPDWFSVVGWMVLDGAMFRMGEDAAQR